MHSVLRDEGGVHLFRAGMQERIKRRADSTFVSDALFRVLLQRGVVVSDRFVTGFEIESRHGDMIAGFGRCIKGK